ncbi:MAG: MFS transporter [Anaerolineae bacterium]|jgi:MFS family permease
MSAIVDKLNATVGALRNRHFRWLWVGRLSSGVTVEMGTVVQGWLVYRLTGSAFALGWVASGWSVATLALSLYGGVISDRIEKRTLLIWSRAGMLVNSLAIAVLIMSDLLQVWHLAANSLLNGVFFAFLMPAQESIVAELVDRRTILNAVSLNAVGFGLMGIVAASTAGALIELIGPAGVYLIMAAVYGGAIYATYKLPRIAPTGDGDASVWSDLWNIVGYLKQRPAILAVLLLGLTRVFFVMPHRTLMPAFSQDNLGFDGAGLGLLMSILAVGAMLGSLIMSSLGDIQGKGRLLLLSGAASGLFLILFVSIPWMSGVFISLAAVGLFNSIYMVLSQALLLNHVDPVYRGRIISISLAEWGLMPLGTLPSGAIADLVGVPPVIIVLGLIVIVVYMGAMAYPVVRRLP